jgi:hypothetical protein
MDQMARQAEPVMCNISGCPKRSSTPRGLCSIHYANLVRYGHPHRGPQPDSAEFGDGLLVRAIRKLLTRKA